MKTNIEDNGNADIADISDIANIQYGAEILDTTVNFANRWIENIAKQNKSWTDIVARLSVKKALFGSLTVGRWRLDGNFLSLALILGQKTVA